VRVTSTSNSSYTDSSDSYFTILSSTPPTPSPSPTPSPTPPPSSNPSITVLSPNGGENWAIGTNQEISWSISGNTGTDVKIEIWENGAYLTNIRSSVANTGSYIWTIPENLPVGSNYQVRVKSRINSAYSDLSDSYFTISI
ncbi:MAG: hypothetical protein OIN87_12730, partial [Candidatus Methanoperedens sp.]|nr:hypothetical protein [Candidatus Methanoperedens sp.]